MSGPYDCRWCGGTGTELVDSITEHRATCWNCLGSGEDWLTPREPRSRPMPNPQMHRFREPVSMQVWDHLVRNIETHDLVGWYEATSSYLLGAAFLFDPWTEAKESRDFKFSGELVYTPS